ncbi:DUF3558 domain-containing protein [Nocardia callitridis]
MPARALLTGLLAITLAAVGVGCSASEGAPQSGEDVSQSGEGSTGTQAARPTITDSKLQPPPQDKKSAVDSGRPPIVFDPCTWVSNSALQRAGFDPSSRRRLDDIVAEYSFLTCIVTSKDRKLRMNSGNATWEENLAKVGSYSQPTNINGRSALQFRDPDGLGSCEIDIQTKVGFVQLAVDLTRFASPEADTCDDIQNIAATIEPEIGKDN